MQTRVKSMKDKATKGRLLDDLRLAGGPGISDENVGDWSWTGLDFR